MVVFFTSFKSISFIPFLPKTNLHNDTQNASSTVVVHIEVFVFHSFKSAAVIFVYIFFRPQFEVNILIINVINYIIIKY